MLHRAELEICVELDQNVTGCCPARRIAKVISTLEPQRAGQGGRVLQATHC